MSEALPLAAAAAASQGQNVVTIVQRTGPEPALWIEWTIGAALLIVIAAIARRRAATQKRMERPHRAFRIVVAALAWASVVTLMLAPQLLSDLSRNPFAVPFPIALLARLVPLTVVAAVLLAVADLLLAYFHPQRTRNWLLIAPPLFAALGVGSIIAFGLGYSTPFPEAGLPVLLPAAVAAALTWWSWLPAPDGQLVQVFE